MGIVERLTCEVRPGAVVPTWRPWREQLQRKAFDPPMGRISWALFDMTRGRLVTGWLKESFYETGIMVVPDGPARILGTSRDECTFCQRVTRHIRAEPDGYPETHCARCGQEPGR